MVQSQRRRHFKLPTAFRVVLVSAVVGLAPALATAGPLSIGGVGQIGPGTSRAQVVGLVGPPDRTEVRGTAEALRYCHTGFSSQEYTTIWLIDGRVRSLTALSTENTSGNCEEAYAPLDWTQAPDVIVEYLAKRKSPARPSARRKSKA